MKQRQPLKRYTPPRKRRLQPRRGEPTKEEKGAIRKAVYERCGGRCELHLVPDCIGGVLPPEGQTPWDHWHLVHLHSKRRFGWTEESGNKLLGGCWKCHLVGMHTKGLKPE